MLPGLSPPQFLICKLNLNGRPYMRHNICLLPRPKMGKVGNPRPRTVHHNFSRLFHYNSRPLLTFGQILTQNGRFLDLLISTRILHCVNFFFCFMILYSTFLGHCGIRFFTQSQEDSFLKLVLRFYKIIQ